MMKWENWVREGRGEVMEVLGGGGSGRREVG